jgi:predicted transcriptional regulator of viral defense system
MATKSKTISFQSAELLNLLNKDDLICFPIDIAYQLLKSSSKDSVKKLLSDMAKRGLLMRVKEGLYYIIPYDQDPKTFMPHWHLLAPHLVGDASYYISYYSAMQIHSLITQPALKEQIVVNKQIKPATLKIKGIPFQFIYHNEKHFFGSKKTWIDSFNKIEYSDLEKIFIDALFKPHYAGGITEITKVIHKSKYKIDYKKLLKYAEQFDSLAVIKRLGYLLELLEIENPIIENLRNRKTNSYFLLERQHLKEGKRIARWNIQENIDKQSILSPIYT